MSLLSQKILGIQVTASSKKYILEEIKKYLNRVSSFESRVSKKGIKPFVIVTPNPEQIVLAQQHKGFAQILNRADVALPDGIGLVTAMRFLNVKSKNLKVKSAVYRIPGVEFMEDLVRLAAERGVRIGLIGGRQGIAVKAFECLRQMYPKLAGWGLDAPEFKLVNHELRIMNHGQRRDISSHNSPFTIHYSNEDEYIREMAIMIEKTDTRMVFVGLGAPKQEYFIERLVSSIEQRESGISTQKTTLGTRHSALVCMSVGGSFDILSGTIQRAPLLIRSIGLEWMWRLIREPWRWKRQVALLRFVLLVLKEKMRTG